VWKRGSGEVVITDEEGNNGKKKDIRYWRMEEENGKIKTGEVEEEGGGGEKTKKISNRFDGN
jgi:hypothetical protein